MASIKPIEAKSIHQIQSGQVIVDLCSVVKELVENSLDAGATSIDVRFKNHGLDAIEVQDNGQGIAPSDYENIALKHYTSKLANYDDLDSLNTFGFRGEALSSLCALSKFHIVTAQDGDAPRGKRLDFEISGKLKSANVVASQKGTTVVTEELFYNLPVRRRELEKNIKREYGKVLNVLHAYACISTKIRFTVSNQTSKSKRAVVFATNGNPTTKENIANVFGAKTIPALITLDLDLELQPTSYLASTDQASRQVRVLGHISRPVSGDGRPTPDRQMFFVNSRPCGLPQIAKAFNEVYRTYNMSQSPFVFADLLMDTNSYDVNVSPDKRTILLHDQGPLLESLKESLVALFDAQEQTVPHSHVAFSQLPALRLNRSESRDAFEGSGKNSFSLEEEPSSSAVNEDQIDSSIEATQEYKNTKNYNEFPITAPTELMQKFVERHFEERKPLKKLQEFNTDSVSKNKKRIAATHITPEQADNEEEDSEEADSHGDEADLQEKSAESEERATRTDVMAPPPILSLGTSKPSSRSLKQSTFHEQPRFRKVSELSKFAKSLRGFAAPSSSAANDGSSSPLGSEGTPEEASIASHEDSSSDEDSERHGDFEPSTQDTEDQVDLEEKSTNEDDEEYIDETERKKRDEERVRKIVQQAEEQAARPTRESKKRAAGILRASQRKDTTLNFATSIKTSIEEINEQLRSLQRSLKSPSSWKNGDGRDDTFNNRRTGNTDEDKSFNKEPTQPTPSYSAKEAAEDKLSLTISKSDFSQMRIVGQFNLGFILATRFSSAAESMTSGESKENLFIIDQHASDEIYNFSRLSLTTTLTPQPLVTPYQLELTAIEEETILSHSNNLSKNGFNVSVDSSGDSPVGQRCRLLTLPTSRETVFNTRDLEELIALLSETTVTAGEVIRPSRVRRMLAMRACRSSIMVGRTLTKKAMREVVNHMGEIERPWNCPHGRPTMRHLAGLGDWNSWREGDGLVDGHGTTRDTDWTRYVLCSKDEEEEAAASSNEI